MSQIQAAPSLRERKSAIIRETRWIELRDPDGRFLAKYDPARGLIAIPHRGRLTLFDLTEIAEPEPA